LAISSQEQKVIAILKRNAQGEFERCGEYVAKEDDEVTWLETNKGAVLIVDPWCDGDEPDIKRLLEEILGS
jgi:hypothetical protein